jgi:alkylation response protein AidB-like acyl-CoA dehydrogenase
MLMRRLRYVGGWGVAVCVRHAELGHGSNVRGLETTATFNQATDEFIIHTPTETAQKYWIGGGFGALRARNPLTHRETRTNTRA